MSVLLKQEPNIYEAVRAFLIKYAFPDIPAPAIRQGWENRTSLPAGTQSYAVMSILTTTRHGTNVIQSTYTSSTFNTHHLENVEALVQIDICASDDSARRRIQAVETIAQSEEACTFFDAYGLAPLSADDVRDTTFIGGESQYVRRYTTSLRLGYWTGLTVSGDFFSTAHISHIYPYF